MVSFRDSNSEWLHTVAHDLKSPINSVRGCVEMVMQLGALNERQEHFAGRALAGLQRMEHLVSRLLDISWVDADAPLDLDVMSIHNTVSEVVDLLHEMAVQRNITVEVNIDSRIGEFIADERRLGQVFDNLLSNAIKYNRQDGSVLVTARYEYDSILVSIQDNGIGIADEEHARIFERFFRSRRGMALKIEGSGLGLAITQAIIKKHGGRIWFESQADLGTTFYFTLPMRVDASDGDDVTAESSQDLGEGKDGRVLWHSGLASEVQDSVDDNLQENRDHTDDESSSDER